MCLISHMKFVPGWAFITACSENWAKSVRWTLIIKQDYWPSVTVSSFQSAGQQLSVSDLLVLMEELYDIRVKWYDIGLQLRMSVGTLDAIKEQYDDFSHCLRETLKMWLKTCPSPPTWKNIVNALRSSPVDEVRLATDLEQKHCSTQDSSIAGYPLSTPFTPPPSGVATASVHPSYSQVPQVTQALSRPLQPSVPAQLTTPQYPATLPQYPSPSSLTTIPPDTSPIPPPATVTTPPNLSPPVTAHALGMKAEISIFCTLKSMLLYRYVATCTPILCSCDHMLKHGI